MSLSAAEPAALLLPFARLGWPVLPFLLLQRIWDLRPKPDPGARPLAPRPRAPVPASSFAPSRQGAPCRDSNTSPRAAVNMPVHARVMCRALPCLAGSSAPPASLCGFCLLTWLNRQPSQRRSTEPGEPALRRPLRFETDPARWARGQARVGSKGDPFGAASGMIFDSFGCQVASLRAAQRAQGCGRSPGFPLRSLRAERAAAVESARWLRGSPDMSLHPISPL